MSDLPLGALRSLLDRHIISHIQNCTNMEPRKIICNEDRSVSCFELLAFVALVCVRGAYGVKNIPLYCFSNKQWRCHFFQRL